MEVYQLLRRGEYHADFCEDFSVVQPMGSGRWLCAVMDGCTMGRESHFASTLAAKIIRKVVKERQYQQFHEDISATSVQQELVEIMAALFGEFQQARNYLLLDTNELLTTLVMALLDQNTGEVYGLAVGDATVAINERITRFEQDNQPDYLAYHLGQHFEEWLAQHKQSFHSTSCTNLGLATDGIDSFQSTDSSPSDTRAIAHYLLVDDELTERSEMLNIKLKRLENRYSLVPMDDLAVVRIRLV
ncbi:MULTISPECIES: protein phosphatase 2C domain-containing protein [Hymenobacter]|uniref:Protein phosphatase 2C n=1 Tax=Hymenobacter mucosus TaxID=1411120 RepID=A0A238V331_9BACT|nr:MULTISPECIES: protein phosphatase 2C domain-containing protein [Hymenobacter]SNR28561.1 Protein phosphatase 2C [Hymenobacter mucosus]